MQYFDVQLLYPILKGITKTISGLEKHFEFDEENGKIIIKALVFQKSLLLDEDVVYPHHIEFIRCRFLGDFVIKAGKFNDITFKGTLLLGPYFLILDGTFENLAFTENCSFDASFKINRGNFKSIGFLDGSTFRRELYIGNACLITLLLSDVVFEQSINLIGFEQVDSIFIYNVKLAELRFFTGNYGNIDVRSTATIGKFIVHAGNFKHLQIDTEGISELTVDKSTNGFDLKIEKITLGQLGKINGFFNQCVINCLEFTPSYIHKDSLLRFLNVQMKSLSFDCLVNYGQLSFAHLQLKEEISFINSDLGKASFINSNLSEVKMNFEDSRITDTFFSKGSLPQRIAEDEHQQRQAFAQLKKINEAKGDYLGANLFYAKEMNAFYETINWKAHFWEKLNLFFNKYSNNHGQSWALSLGVVWVGSALFFTVYLLCLDIYPASWASKSNWDLFFKCLSYFLEFLNPVHRTDEIAKGIGIKPSSAGRLIEGISRIFIAFAIYQLIQAFRKHGKK